MKGKPVLPSGQCTQWTVLPCIVQPTGWKHQRTEFAELTSGAGANVCVQFEKKPGNTLPLGF